MTKADQIRKLAARGVDRRVIAQRAKVPLRRVSDVLWEDANRERVRQIKLRWQKKARENPDYREMEAISQAEYYKRKCVERRE